MQPALRQLGRGQALLRRSRPAHVQCRASITPRPVRSLQTRATLSSICSRSSVSPLSLRRALEAPHSPLQLRTLSTASGALPVEVRAKSRVVRWLWKGFTVLGIFVGVSGGLVLAFFAYDASTYKENAELIDLNVSEYALNPRRGGPKNLPIVDHLVDDDDSPEKKAQKHKPKLVILGTGWGSVALLKQLNPDDYHVTVVAPSNYFLFTPMLPSATVGTLEIRSLVEPVRRIVARVYGHFLKGQAEDVDFSAKLVEISSIGPDGDKQHFYLPYDKLVIGVGEFNAATTDVEKYVTNIVRFNYQSTRCQGAGELPLPQRHHRCSPYP